MEVTRFNSDNSDILTSLIFEDWVRVPAIRIVRLMLVKNRNRLFSSRSIAVMIGASLASTLESLQLLRANEYITVVGGNYCLNLERVSDRKSDQSSPEVIGKAITSDRESDQLGDRKSDQQYILPLKDLNIETNIEIKKDLITNVIRSKEGENLSTLKTRKSNTEFNKHTSITREQYLTILAAPPLGDNDKTFVLACLDEMGDWAASKGVKKVDWAATLRNWIRRARKEQQKFEKRPKTFTELEADNLERERQIFLDRNRGWVDPHKK